MHTLFRVRRSLLLPAFLAATIACDQTFSEESSVSIQLPFPSEPSQSQPSQLVFFPPVPPPLEFLSSRSIASPTSLGAPPELSPYVSEIFYPQLASLVHRGNLFSSRREALRKYHDEKRALQQELRTELTRAETLDPAARTAHLAELASLQDPKILGLEARAEQLRHELYEKGSDWSALREWHLGESATLPDSASEVAQVMQAAAFFQDGLSVQQRGLLREFATEIIAGLPASPSYADVNHLVESLPADQKTAARQAIYRNLGAAPPPIDSPSKPGSIYFSPSLTRLRLPDNLPASVQARLKDYSRRKIALRQQLLDIIRKEDIPKPGRTQRFADLAAAQASGFAELETLAEEIRRELPPSPPPVAPLPLVPLPAALTERLIAFSDRLPAVQADAKSKKYKGSVDLPGSLGRERAALRADIAAALPPDDPSLAEVALSDGPRLSLIRRVTPALATYQIAALLPGLSPPQRRLLFDGAVEDLRPALPNGRVPPTRRPLPLPLQLQHTPR